MQATRMRCDVVMMARLGTLFWAHFWAHTLLSFASPVRKLRENDERRRFLRPPPSPNSARKTGRFRNDSLRTLDTLAQRHRECGDVPMARVCAVAVSERCRSTFADDRCVDGSEPGASAKPRHVRLIFPACGRELVAPYQFRNRPSSSRNRDQADSSSSIK